MYSDGDGEESEPTEHTPIFVIDPRLPELKYWLLPAVDEAATIPLVETYTTIATHFTHIDNTVAQKALWDALTYNSPTPLQQPTDTDAQLTHINEGQINAIFLLKTKETPTRKLTIISAKDATKSAELTQRDAKNLQHLKHWLEDNDCSRLLTVPTVHASLEIPRFTRRDTLRINITEYLGDTHFELSAFTWSGSPEEIHFEVNLPISTDASSPERVGKFINLLQDPDKKERVTYLLAQNQTLVWRAFDGRTQDSLSINSGDYMIGFEDEQPHLALITLREGLTQHPLTLTDFVVRTLNYHEQSFSPQFGELKTKVFPFAYYPEQTIAGIYEGLTAGRRASLDSRAFQQALTESMPLIENSDLPDVFKTKIVTALRQWEEPTE